MALDAGPHEVRADLEGYESGATRLTLETGKAAPPAEITLKPLAQSLRISNDLGPCQVTLNGGAPSPLAEPGFQIETLSAGRHSVKVFGAGREASFSFEVNPGATPSVTGAIATKNALAVLVSAMGRKARLVTNSGPWKLMVNGVCRSRGHRSLRKRMALRTEHGRTRWSIRLLRRNRCLRCRRRWL